MWSTGHLKLLGTNLWSQSLSKNSTVRIKETWCLKTCGSLSSVGPDSSVVAKPSWQRHHDDVITYPTNLADSGTPRWQLGSRQHEHNHTSSGSPAQMCPSAQVNKCQRAKNYQGNLLNIQPAQSESDKILRWQCVVVWTACRVGTAETRGTRVQNTD